MKIGNFLKLVHSGVSLQREGCDNSYQDTTEVGLLLCSCYPQALSVPSGKLIVSIMKYGVICQYLSCKWCPIMSKSGYSLP
jgi:hypothetical protein